MRKRYNPPREVIDMAQEKPTLPLLFVRTFLISACTFGGGFVIAGLMKKEFVDKRRWLEEGEMLDYVAIAQSCPGAIAVNTAILTGLRLGGIPGMLVSVAATVLPPMLILALVSVFYNAFASSRVVSLLLTGMQAGVTAVILDVVLSLAEKVLKNRCLTDIAVMVIAFALCRVPGMDVTWIVLGTLAFGMIRVLLRGKRREKKC